MVLAPFLGIGPSPLEVEGPQKNPVPVWRQGTLILLAWGYDWLASRALCCDAYLIHKTLGNGYLGSRIDEERSKMRYLV